MSCDWSVKILNRFDKLEHGVTCKGYGYHNRASI